ncbi:MAG0480 family ComEC-like protein [Mycoplasma sp. 1654_15]|uniref:MAG0480 family ComEC-like protein n=1 Tax=Mycoplasma sp. 1654_15 TaxID=2725994 RepID=UPI0020C4091D|nr:ComEC/Rec2 family competence protein [Mycoplasma sp. 1654_15]
MNQASINSFVVNSQVSITNKNALGVIFQFEDKNIFLKDKNLDINDQIFIYGKAERIVNSSSDFNIENYLKSYKTFFEIKAITSLKIIKKHQDWKSNFFHFVTSGNTYYSQVFPISLLGENYILENTFITNLKQLNVYHLFVISGFHLLFFKKFIFKIFQFIKLNFLISNFLFLFFLLFVNYLLNFPISFLRATLFFIFSLINKQILKNYFKNFEVLSFVAIVFILWNPLVIYSFSYIFTFLITLILLYCSHLKFNNKWWKNIITSLISHTFASVLLLMFNNKYNVFGYLNSFIFVPVFVFIYTVGWIFIWEKNLLDFIAQFILWLVDQFTKFQFYIYLIKLNFLTVFVSYIIFSVCFLFTELIHISQRKKLSKF